MGNLSVSDLRGLSAEDFPSLLLPTTQYLASRTGAAPTQVRSTQWGRGGRGWDPITIKRIFL